MCFSFYKTDSYDLLLSWAVKQSLILYSLAVLFSYFPSLNRNPIPLRSLSGIARAGYAFAYVIEHENGNVNGNVNVNGNGNESVERRENFVARVRFFN